MKPALQPDARQALWLQRMRQDLPAAATRRPEWPIRLDHCFARVILDEVCGGPWRERIAAPAWRHLSPTALNAAIALADAILDGRVDLDALNRRSLAARRLQCAASLTGVRGAGSGSSSPANLWRRG